MLVMILPGSNGILLYNIPSHVFIYSKVVSTDHNKPIIVPAGQDSFANIGMVYLVYLSLRVFYCIVNALLQAENS